MERGTAPTSTTSPNDPTVAIALDADGDPVALIGLDQVAGHDKCMRIAGCSYFDIIRLSHLSNFLFRLSGCGNPETNHTADTTA